MNLPELFRPADKYQAVPGWALLPPGGDYYTDGHTGISYVRWLLPVPRPETIIDKRTGKPQVVPAKAQPGKPEPNPTAEPRPEPETPSFSYVEFVTPEEEEVYAHGTASEKQGETPVEYTKRRTRGNKAAIFAEMEAEEKAASQPENRPQAGPVRAMPVLAEDALYGMFGRIVRFIEPATEADRAAILVQLLIASVISLVAVPISLSRLPSTIRIFLRVWLDVLLKDVKAPALIISNRF
jgi:hypothetical protein